MIESNDIWSVMKYIWEWMSTTVWYEGEIFGVPANWTVLDFWLFPLIGAILIFLVRLVFWLADE